MADSSLAGEPEPGSKATAPARIRDPGLGERYTYLGRVRLG